MVEPPRRTQLYLTHKQTAKMTTFAGYEMPLVFKGIIPEHLAVRNSVGVFDISHMGRVIVTGADAENFLNHVITNDVSKLAPNSAQYSVMCTENGGIVDDFVIYKMEAGKFLVVFNAGNREKDYNWLEKHTNEFKVKLEGVSDTVAMLAVQGPDAAKILQNISSEDLGKIERFKCGFTQLSNVKTYLARTGYTGEDGFEIFIWNTTISDPENAVKVWNSILESGKQFGVEPCGLGARDTLRLEAGLCLYGNDIDERTTPLEAGLGFVVKFQKNSFLGKEALLKQKNVGLKRKRVGVCLSEQGIPRPGFEILNQRSNKIGNLTSGTFSPLLKSGIGMGYVQTEEAQEGNIIRIRIRDRDVNGKIVAFPFYDDERYGYKRKMN
jgi:aminomethyltransferase